MGQWGTGRDVLLLGLYSLPPSLLLLSLDVRGWVGEGWLGPWTWEEEEESVGLCALCSGQCRAGSLLLYSTVSQPLTTVTHHSHHHITQSHYTLLLPGTLSSPSPHSTRTTGSPPPPAIWGAVSVHCVTPSVRPCVSHRPASLARLTD